MEQDFIFLLSYGEKMSYAFFSGYKMVMFFLGRPSDKLQSHSANSSNSARGVPNFYKYYVLSEHVQNITSVESFR